MSGVTEPKELLQGTREEHLATLERAKLKHPSGFSIWTGDVRRNPYLYENLGFAESENIATVKLDVREQESYFVISWVGELPRPKDPAEGRSTNNGEQTS